MAPIPADMAQPTNTTVAVDNDGPPSDVGMAVGIVGGLVLLGAMIFQCIGCRNTKAKKAKEPREDAHTPADKPLPRPPRTASLRQQRDSDSDVGANTLGRAVTTASELSAEEVDDVDPGDERRVSTRSEWLPPRPLTPYSGPRAHSELEAMHQANPLPEGAEYPGAPRWHDVAGDVAERESDTASTQSEPIVSGYPDLSAPLSDSGPAPSSPTLSLPESIVAMYRSSFWDTQLPELDSSSLIELPALPASVCESGSLHSESWGIEDSESLAELTNSVVTPNGVLEEGAWTESSCTLPQARFPRLFVVPSESSEDTQSEPSHILHASNFSEVDDQESQVRDAGPSLPVKCWTPEPCFAGRLPDEPRLGSFASRIAALKSMGQGLDVPGCSIESDATVSKPFTEADVRSREVASECCAPPKRKSHRRSRMLEDLPEARANRLDSPVIGLQRVVKSSSSSDDSNSREPDMPTSPPELPLTDEDIIIELYGPSSPSRCAGLSPGRL